MTAKATFTLEADPQKVIAAITKLEEKVSALEAKNRQLRQASVRGTDDANKGMSSLDRTIERVTGGVASMGAAFLSLNGALSVIKAIDAQLDAISKKSAAMGNASKDLASQVSSPEVVQAVKKQAVDMGVKPSEAVQYAGTLTALFGEEGMKKAMPAANKLKKMDVATEDISAIGTAASASNLDFSTTASAFGVAATESALPPKELAKAAPAWMEYKDARSGMAASAALAAGGVAPGSLMDRTKDLSLGLKMDSDLKKKAEREAGGANEYAALSEVEQLAVMKSVTPDLNQDNKLSIEEVMKAGITEQQKAQSIAIAANQIDKFRSSEAAVMQASPEALDAIIAKQERNDPSVVDANRAEASAANAEYMSTYGPGAEMARKNTESKQAAGKRLQEWGAPVGVDIETGQATPWLGRFMDFMSPPEPTKGAIDKSIWRSETAHPASAVMSASAPPSTEVTGILGTTATAGAPAAGPAAPPPQASESGPSGGAPASNVMTEDTGRKIEGHLAVIAANTKQEQGAGATAAPGPNRNEGV